MYILGTIITPSITTTLSEVADNASPIITEYWDWAMLAIAIIVGFGLLGWLISQFSRVFHH